MSKEAIFQTWAPEGPPWSRWVKPVLFACMGPAPPPDLPAFSWDATWAPAPQENTALVLDLPGLEGVAAALAVARHGYRPVPLYNATPIPTSVLNPSAVMAVDVSSLISALWHATPFLQEIHIPFEAPPAFVLDWQRSGEGRRPGPGAFDNRSVSFTTDFPSANFLLAHGIRRVVLAQPTLDRPQPDLAHTLRRWQDAGVVIDLKRLDMPGGPVRFKVAKPSWFGWAFQRTLAAFGLRRAAAGGFGGWVPHPSSG